MRDEMKLTMNAIAENEYFAPSCGGGFFGQDGSDHGRTCDIKTAVSEAVTNAVVHGYDHKGGIEIDARIEDDGWRLKSRMKGLGLMM